MTVNEKLLELILRRAHYLVRLAQWEANQTVDRFDRLVYEPVMQRLKEYGHFAEYEKLVGDGYQEIIDRAIRDLEKVATIEAAWAAKSIEDLVPVKFGVVGPRMLKAATVSKPFEGKTMRHWFQLQSRRLQRDLKRTIRESIAEGLTIKETARRIRGTPSQDFKDGIMQARRYQAEAIARTATNHVSNNAREATYAENSDIVKQWQFVATLDARTTIICMAADGKVHKVGEGRRPPLHWGCRSTTVPVLGTWQELGLGDLPPAQRSSLDGVVPADMDYSQFLRKQDRAFQDEMLGERRAALWRSGKVRMDQFTNRRGRVLTVEELEELV